VTGFPDHGILEQDVKNRHIIETSNPPSATKAIIRIGRVLTQTQALSRTASIVVAPRSFLQGKSSAGPTSQSTGITKKIRLKYDSYAFPQQNTHREKWCDRQEPKCTIFVTNIFLNT
jgi:hypothetical protein